MNMETRPSDRIYWRIDNFGQWQSFGHVAFSLAKAMLARGVESVFMPVGRIPAHEAFEPWIVDRCRPADYHAAPWCLQISSPQIPHATRKRTVHMTSWDSDSLRTEQIENLNKSYGVAAPSTFHRDLWAQLLNVKVVAVPHGVDTALYYPRRVPPLEPFVFGAAGQLVNGPRRKNLAWLAQQFVRIKGRMPGSKLRLKITPWDRKSHDIPSDPDIEIIDTILTAEEMAEWYSSLSVFVLPSRGECWGLHAHHAMACGRPVIAGRWGGHLDYWDESCGWALEHTMETADDPGWHDTGRWAVPTATSLHHAMTHAYDHPYYIAEKGAIAAARAAQFTWDAAAEKLHGFLADVGMLAQYAGYEPKGWSFRAGSNDKAIFEYAMTGNEYELPKRFPEGSVVLDLGAHVGGFSVNAARRGARVIALEADPEAATMAAANCAAAGLNGAVQVRCAAVWPTAGEWARVVRVPKNTGANWVEVHGPTPGNLDVATVTLPALLGSIDGRVAFIKFDIEGAELPVLRDCMDLEKVDRIAGEYHRVQGAEPGLIRAILEERGFEVKTHANPECDLVGWFHAKRRETAPAG